MTKVLNKQGEALHTEIETIIQRMKSGHGHPTLSSFKQTGLCNQPHHPVKKHRSFKIWNGFLTPGMSALSLSTHPGLRNNLLSTKWLYEPSPLRRSTKSRFISRLVICQNKPSHTNFVMNHGAFQIYRQFVDHYKVCRVWMTVSCGLVVTTSWDSTTCRENYWAPSKPNQWTIHGTYQWPGVAIWCTLIGMIDL